MIGWYVHHQGHGHLQRMRAVSRHLTAPPTVLSSLPRPHDWPGEWVELPLDDDGGPSPDPTAGGVLHWAPLGQPGLLARGAAVTAWVERTRPDAVVVDVSVEIALTVRLLGVPVVVVAMQGDRGDRAHVAAYDLASGLVAPWPRGLPGADLRPQWSAKTRYVGAFSRFDDRALPPRPTPGRNVLLLWGSGGSDVSEEELAEARRATPAWTWTYRRGGEGRVTDVWDDLLAADVVVVHGGQNAVAEVAAARRPAVVVAQRRPHDEQEHRARTLDDAGLAVGLPRWPHTDLWPGLLDRAVALGGDGWSRWSAGDGARQAARAIDELTSS